MKFKLFTFISSLLLWGSSLSAAVLPPGSLDPTFGTNQNGLVRIDRTNEGMAANASIIQPDGKIVVVGASQATGKDKNFLLIRYNVDGTIDTSFGNQGFVITDLSAHAPVNHPNADDEATAIALDGEKLIVAGYITNLKGDKDFALVRFQSNGSFDETFANNLGVNTFDLDGYNEIPTAIAIQPNQKIIVVGRQVLSFTDEDMIVVEYHLNGQIAELNGKQKISTIAWDLSKNSNDRDIPHSVQIQNDGKIVIAGSASDLPVVFRIEADFDNSTGIQLDTAFGAGHRFFNPAGVLLFDPAVGFEMPSGSFETVVIQPDQKIIAAGTVRNAKDEILFVHRCADQNCTKVDSTFAPRGIGMIFDSFEKNDQGDPSVKNTLQGMSLQSDGKILINGIVNPLLIGTGSSRFGLARYNTDGTADTTFGSNGKVLTSLDNFIIGSANNLLIQPSGERIVIVGNTIDSNLVNAPTLLRYFSQATDPTPPTPPPPSAPNSSSNGGGCSLLSTGNPFFFSSILWLIPFGIFIRRRAK